MKVGDTGAAVAMAGFAGGTFCTGLVLSAVHLNPLTINLSAPSSDLTTWGASLLGALVGGGLSISATMVFNRQQRKATEVGRAHNVLQVATVMRSQMLNTVGYIDQQLGAGHESIAEGAPKWAVVSPLAISHSDRRFEPDDLSIFIAAREFQLHTDLVTLEMNHQALQEAWVTFCATRRELRDFMNVRARDGKKITSEVDLEKNPQAYLRMMELETLLDSILKQAPQFLLHSQKVMAMIGPAFKRYFRDPKFPGAQ